MKKSFVKKIGVERCRCGHPACTTYWLTGVGRFVQGSGFDKSEAEEISKRWNGPKRKVRCYVIPVGEGHYHEPLLEDLLRKSGIRFWIKDIEELRP